MFISDLKRSFALHAARVAVQFPRRVYTFNELEQAAERVAAVLAARGVVTGDRVALFMEAKEPFLLGYLGALWAGAVALPLNPGLKGPELQYFIADSQASAIVCDAAAVALVDEVRVQLPQVRAIIGADELRAGHDPTAYRSPVLRPGDPALMLYSSGTTGEPKGVVHTHANLAHSVRAIADAWRFTADDVLVNVLPLFHIHGLSFATNVSLVSGGSMLVGDSFHPVRTLDLIDRATVFMGVPPYYYSLLKRDEFPRRAAGWRDLRLATCGSAPIRSEVLPQLEAILGRPIINRYGMTECHILTSLPLDGPWPHGSVGMPLGGVEVCVRADDSPESKVASTQVRESLLPLPPSPGGEGRGEGAWPEASLLQTPHPNPLPAAGRGRSVVANSGARATQDSVDTNGGSGTDSQDRVGRVCARGPNLFREYWRRPQETAATFDRDGWFDTGDLGRIDERGFLTLVGRGKDLIIVGGFNVYPAVVERVLAEYPGVRDCAVVGLPDADRGERVAAFVVTDGSPLDAKRLRSFCRERLADYQCPTQFESIAELPRNNLGKVLRRELRGND
jgi:acyl-CoA synthetase (AMP-forming)/AMP-acid ligase II